jgi:type VI protein secretion system component Hcp
VIAAALLSLVILDMPSARAQALGQISFPEQSIAPSPIFGVGLVVDRTDLGKVTLGPLHIVKIPDGISAFLLLTLLQETALPQVQIDFTPPETGNNIRYLLTNVFLRRIDYKTKSGGEEIELDYEKITITRTGPNGTTTACWDVGKNSSC